MALAAYIAAVYPAGPDPIINTFECDSFILTHLLSLLSVKLI